MMSESFLKNCPSNLALETHNYSRSVKKRSIIHGGCLNTIAWATMLQDPRAIEAHRCLLMDLSVLLFQRWGTAGQRPKWTMSHQAPIRCPFDNAVHLLDIHRVVVPWQAYITKVGREQPNSPLFLPPTTILPSIPGLRGLYRLLWCRAS